MYRPHRGARWCSGDVGSPARRRWTRVTPVIAADDSDNAAGAAAALLGDCGGAITLVARRNRSLPTLARGQDGARHTYADPRLQREVGVKSTLARLNLADSPVVAVGAWVRKAKATSGWASIPLPLKKTRPLPAAAVIRLDRGCCDRKSLQKALIPRDRAVDGDRRAP